MIFGIKIAIVVFLLIGGLVFSLLDLEGVTEAMKAAVLALAAAGTLFIHFTSCQPRGAHAGHVVGGILAFMSARHWIGSEAGDGSIPLLVEGITAIISILVLVGYFLGWRESSRDVQG